MPHISAPNSPGNKSLVNIGPGSANFKSRWSFYAEKEKKKKDGPGNLANCTFIIVNTQLTNNIRLLRYQDQLV